MKLTTVDLNLQMIDFTTDQKCEYVEDVRSKILFEKVIFYLKEFKF